MTCSGFSVGSVIDARCLFEFLDEVAELEPTGLFDLRLRSAFYPLDLSRRSPIG